MELQTRKLLSDDDDDLKKFCDSDCYSYSQVTCPSDCRVKCLHPCLGFQFSIPPPDSTTSDSPHKLSTLLICTIALLSFTFFLVLCYAVYVRFYSGRRRRRSDPPTEETQRQFLDEEHGPVLDHPIWYIRTVGLPPSVISAITVCKYKSGDGLIDGTECSVCLSEFEEDETLRLLPKCSHAFHLPCIDTWLRSHTNCPMCRAPIVVETARTPSVESDSANSGLPEEELAGNLQSFVESEREEEDDGVLRSRTVTEDEDELRFPVDDGRERTHDSDEGVGDVQPMRRSVSLDSLSVLQLKMDFQTELGRGNASNRVRENQNPASLMIGSSSDKSQHQQSKRSSMNRSVSCSGKFLLRNSTHRSNGINHS